MSKHVKLLVPKNILEGLNIIMWVSAAVTFYVDNGTSSLGIVIWIGLAFSLVSEFLQKK